MKIYKHQQWHILILIALLSLLYFYVKKDPSVLTGELWGISTFYWCIITLASPILHQAYVLFCWRYELHYKGLSRWWGKSGFRYFKIGFAILILSRPTTITLLAIANRDSLCITPEIAYLLSGILVLPAIYLFYSVKTYFGMDRAFGIDHFYPEEYHNKPFVKQGIFKYTSNGMYIFGFLILWIPGLLLLSKAALLLALFNHVYIWVHYYFIELPDMKTIYNNHDHNLSNSN